MQSVSTSGVVQPRNAAPGKGADSSLLRWMGPPKQSAFRTGSLDGVVDDYPLPAIARTNHEIAFRWRR
jgi:hypothetical protein